MGPTTGERKVGHRRPIRFRRIYALCLIAAVALGATLTPRPAQAAGELKLPAAIDATGKKDVSAQMSAFFASVPANTRVVFPSRGRFRMEKTLVLDRRFGLTIEGNA
jgi:hypothetical protein